MAEAIVDGNTQPISRFFCHQCSVEIDKLLPDYTCPRCSTGFIEELEKENVNDSSMDVSNEDLSDLEFEVPGLSDSDPLGIPLSIIRELTDPQNSSRNNASRRRSRRSRDLAESPYSNESTPRNTRSNTSRSRSQQQQGSMPLHLENLIQNFFMNLSGIGFGIPQGQGGQPSVFDVRLFLGNPGDYVWGQNGLDSIVTQLLNQMDGTGPPPLPKKLIAEIPTTQVSESQIERKLQCSVCWEDFILAEPVRKLPCLHYYHEPCIVPWLELHGTCPICRQSLGEQSTIDANQDTVGPSLAALFRAANESSSSRTSSASLGSSSRNDSPNEL